ncbi:MAG: hypothetical protein LBS91_09485, partial [Clostridiales Family XIII bacterium]|nr:hypothetical protein [Clostridiales Family XIII bacterium]
PASSLRAKRSNPADNGLLRLLRTLAMTGNWLAIAWCLSSYNAFIALKNGCEIYIAKRRK